MTTTETTIVRYYVTHELHLWHLTKPIESLGKALTKAALDHAAVIEIHCERDEHGNEVQVRQRLMEDFR
jgi:hypothetical protein